MDALAFRQSSAFDALLDAAIDRFHGDWLGEHRASAKGVGRTVFAIGRGGGEKSDGDVFQLRVSLEGNRQFVAGHAGHDPVEQNEVGFKLLGGLDGPQGIVFAPDLVLGGGELEKPGEASFIVDGQDSGFVMERPNIHTDAYVASSLQIAVLVKQRF